MTKLSDFVDFNVSARCLYIVDRSTGEKCGLEFNNMARAFDHLEQDHKLSFGVTEIAKLFQAKLMQEKLGGDKI